MLGQSRLGAFLYNLRGDQVMAKTMKAAVVREFGKPLVIEEMPIQRRLRSNAGASNRGARRARIRQMM
jgi:hypothetical protein